MARPQPGFRMPNGAVSVLTLQVPLKGTIYGDSRIAQTYPLTDYIPAADCTIAVLCVGGGGGGGASTALPGGAGGGGGGGAAAFSVLQLTAAQVRAATLFPGPGGGGGVTDGGLAEAGGDSKLVVDGVARVLGKGGDGGSNGTGAGGGGGALGGFAGDCVGDHIFGGGNGDDGQANANAASFGGGGGSCANEGNAGVNAIGSIGGLAVTGGTGLRAAGGNGGQDGTYQGARGAAAAFGRVPADDLNPAGLIFVGGSGGGGGGNDNDALQGAGGAGSSGYVWLWLLPAGPAAFTGGVLPASAELPANTPGSGQTRCLELPSGSGTYVDFNSYLPTNVVAISCWLKLTATSGAFVVGQFAGTDAGWDLAVDESGQLTFAPALDAETPAFLTWDSIDPGAWTHCVLIRDAGDGSAQLWVNGALVAHDDTGGGSGAAAELLVGTESIQSFRLMDLRLYSAALSGADIALLYNSGAPSNDATLQNAALLNRWKFDEGTGTTAADSKGDKPGTLRGAATWATDAPPRRSAPAPEPTDDSDSTGAGCSCLSLMGTGLDTGNSEYVSFGGGTPGSNVLSISCWLKIPGGSSSGPLVWSGFNGGDPTGWDYGIHYVSGTGLRFHATGSGAPVLDGSPPLDEWAHYLMVLDDGSGACTVYKNGALLGSSSDVGTGSTSQLLLGHTSGRGADFQMVDLRLYSAALVAADAGTIYGAGCPSEDDLAADAALLDRWLLDEGTGTQIADSAGSMTGDLYNLAGTGWAGDCPCTLVSTAVEDSGSTLLYSAIDAERSTSLKSLLPAGVWDVTLAGWGGGGGAASYSTVQGGSGGGGGAYAEATFTFDTTQDEDVTLTCGRPGAAGTLGAGMAGQDGTASRAVQGGTTLLSAAPGAGGGDGNTNNGTGGQGGQAADCVGVNSRTGGAGGNGGKIKVDASQGGPFVGFTKGGGGGSSASSAGGAGHDGFSGECDVGGVIVANQGHGGLAGPGQGEGGNGVFLIAAGHGSTPGGGGGGGGKNVSSPVGAGDSARSGQGGRGKISVRWVPHT